MIAKLNPTYLMNIEGNDGRMMEIGPPFTIEFAIQRNSLSSANSTTLRIYNLGEDTRSNIRKDQYDFLNFKRVSLLAGYGENLSAIMSGNVIQAFSVLEGVNMITQIESFDGGFGFANATISRNFPSGSDYRSIVQEAISTMEPYGIQMGKIGEFNYKATKEVILCGSTMKELRGILNNSLFVDLGKAYVLSDNEYILGEVDIIDSESGLLGTPKRETNLLNIDVLFEPTLKIGQRIRLISSTDQDFNNYYKVVAINHSGMISPSTASRLITRVGLLWLDKDSKLIT